MSIFADTPFIVEPSSCDARSGTFKNIINDDANTVHCQYYIVKN